MNQFCKILTDNLKRRIKEPTEASGLIQTNIMIFMGREDKERNFYAIYVNGNSDFIHISYCEVVSSEISTILTSFFGRVSFKNLIVFSLG